MTFTQCIAAYLTGLCTLPLLLVYLLLYPPVDRSKSNRNRNPGEVAKNDSTSSKEETSFSGWVSIKGVSGTHTLEDPFGSVSSKGGRNSKAHSRYFSVLRHGNLFFYDNLDQIDVKHVLVLSRHSVSVKPVPEIDGDLWSKHTAIVLSRRKNSSSDPPGENSRVLRFLIYNENNSEKEDLYFALLKICHPDEATPLRFHPSHMLHLIQSLHVSEASMQTRWINAVIGRVFLGVYQTQSVRQFALARIVKKLMRVNRPGFLADIAINDVDIGDSLPAIINPRLRDLNLEGELLLDADITYSGAMRIDLATKVILNFGARFGTKEVDLRLAVVLRKLEGSISVKIKQPPSNRIWWTFKEPPRMDLVIEPIVSTRQMSYGVVTKAIESKIREVVMSSLVFPNWDDIPFASTIDEKIIGGLWKEGKRETPELAPVTVPKSRSTEDIPSITPKSLRRKSVSTTGSVHPILPESKPEAAINTEFSESMETLPAEPVATWDEDSENLPSVPVSVRERLANALSVDKEKDDGPQPRSGILGNMRSYLNRRQILRSHDGVIENAETEAEILNAPRVKTFPVEAATTSAGIEYREQSMDVPNTLRPAKDVPVPKRRPVPPLPPREASDSTSQSGDFKLVVPDTETTYYLS